VQVFDVARANWFGEPLEQAEKTPALA